MTETTVNILFYIFASFAVVSALWLVLSKNPVQAVVALVFTFIASAAVWITMQQEYLALLLIVVYVGAVMVMFLFVVMMLDITLEVKRSRMVVYWPLAVLVCIGFAVFMSFMVIDTFAGVEYANKTTSVYALGQTMFGNDYLYVFELMGMVLLSAMIAAIALTFRGQRGDNKAVDVQKQLRADPSKRLKMVQMKSEKTQQKGEQSHE